MADIISSFKIEKLRKEQKLAQKRKERAELPVLNAQQIRRCRLPYYETILADLGEANYTNAADFIQQLMNFQEELRNKKGPGTMTWLRPRLCNSNKELDILSQHLGQAEQAHNDGNHKVEWDQMLFLASYFAYSDNWTWIGEQILSQCLGMEYPGNFEREIAITNYFVGKFLIERTGKKDQAVTYLETAREISIGKSWKCDKYLKGPQDNIFVESCKMLCTILLEDARNIMNYDPVEAIEICTLARKRAVESCQEKKAFEALILRGQCELAANDTHSAIGTLKKLLSAAIRKECPEDICEAKIYLAVALLRHGKRQEALIHLKELRHLAEENNLNYYLGLAYRYIGEYFLNVSDPKKATPFLMTAFYIFHKLGDVRNREELRTLAAISAGHELYPIFINIIKKSDNVKYGQKYFDKLVRWKDDRAIFWTKKQSSFSLTQEPAKEDIEMDDNDDVDVILDEDEDEEIINPDETYSLFSDFYSICSIGESRQSKQSRSTRKSSNKTISSTLRSGHYSKKDSYVSGINYST